MARRMVQVYADFATDVAAMPVVVGADMSPRSATDSSARSAASYRESISSTRSPRSSSSSAGTTGASR